MKKWLGVPNSLTNMALYSSSTIVKLLTLSIAEEYKLGKEPLFQMLHNSHNLLVKNMQPSVITSWKWKTKIAVENAELTLKMNEIIDAVANGRVGYGLHPQHWWFKEYTKKQKKMVSEEIHHLEEVKRIATAVRQRKQCTWIRWESAKDRAVIWSNLKHIEPKKLSFLIKVVYNVLPTPINLHTWGLTISNQCTEGGINANFKHIFSGCEYALRDYTRRHNEVLEIFAEISKMCSETANKVLNNSTNRAIHFVKE